MKPLLIIGAGSFASEVEEMARLLGYSAIAFLDDNPDCARCSPVVGNMDDIVNMKDHYPEAIVALGNNEARMKYHNLIKNAGFTVPVLIHPTAYASPDAVWSPGCIVRAKAVVSRYARLGEACIINVGGMIDHDCVLGNGCHILMGAVVRNEVIHFLKKEKRYGKKEGIKKRHLHYSAHLDRCVYQRYAFLINYHYNMWVQKHDISEVAIAYRDNLQKNNIDFAKDAFTAISSYAKCFVMIGDFTDFFDSLDHEHLKKMLCKVLCVERLPDDYFAVFKNITRFASWDWKDLVEAACENICERKLRKKLNSKTTIITKEQFCEHKSSIYKNNTAKGIPQGSPITLHLQAFRNMFHKLREQLHTKMLKSQANVSFDEDELNMRILNTELFNKNPFKTEQAVGGSKGSRFTGADTKELNEYIKKSITTWDFKELLTGVEKNETTKIKFYYVFSNESYSLLSDMHEKDKFLCKDGRFRVVDYSDIEPRFYITDRAQATVFKDKLEERIDQILKEKGFSYFSSSKYDLTIKLMKCGKPEHLFTRREIEIALRNADDRVSNQLVIDEDGYAKIIQKLEMAPLYPVSMESWDAGNVYVGKYAKNIPKIAEDSYMLILEGWLDYLKTGRRQYKDYFSGVVDENSLLNKIKELY